MRTAKTLIRLGWAEFVGFVVLWLHYYASFMSKEVTFLSNNILLFPEHFCCERNITYLIRSRKVSVGLI